MKRYRIKPQGVEDEVGRLLVQDSGVLLIKLNIAPKQVYIAELIDDTSNFIESVQEIMPDARIVKELKETVKRYPDPNTDKIDLENIPL